VSKIKLKVIVMTKLSESGIMKDIFELKKKMIKVLSDAESEIEQLEGLKARAFSLGLFDDVDKLSEYIKQIEAIQDDFRGSFVVKIQMLSDEMESEDKSAFELMEHVRSNGRELIERKIKYAPEFIENLSISYENCYSDLEALFKRFEQRKL
jgi:hypothetical protein